MAAGRTLEGFMEECLDIGPQHREDMATVLSMVLAWGPRVPGDPGPATLQVVLREQPEPVSTSLSPSPHPLAQCQERGVGILQLSHLIMAPSYRHGS